MGFVDTEIAEQLRLTRGAVRNCGTRFRKALHEAARQRRMWIPEQIHSTVGTRQQAKGGAA